LAVGRPEYLIFISHSSEDRWIAGQMAAIIERKAKRYGVGTFLTTSISRAATASRTRSGGKSRIATNSS
jgi:hypothetical protein